MIKTKAVVATVWWRHGNSGSFLSAVSGSAAAAAQQKGGGKLRCSGRAVVAGSLAAGQWQ
jgi:hypothetical protein